MLKHPETKYRPMPPVGLKDRTWPDQVISKPPIWMSTDLRDGNQALFEPMDAQRKMRMFKTLCAIGIKQIEVAFPSASQTDFDFVRELIEGGHIPDDVTIEVLTQAREDLIRRTFESLRGARQAIVHVYNATAPNFRRIVFNVDEAGCTQIAVNAARLIKQLAAERPETRWTFQYSPEVFSGTELPFAASVCNAVTAVWQPTPENKIIFNLPATVEMSTPNVYADQIEWMHRHLDQRDSILLSVHPHNDRGCAVAAAELAVMAGADRVEGCLFGNGERTGNVDLVTLALNLYTQGIHPGLDFSNINAVARTVEDCNQIPIHPRHPYVGDLVFTAFSGSHQDAIKKGFAAQKATAIWEVPYLPVDPADLGRTYDSVIRVNSQSGKGGIAYLLESTYGLVMPRRLQVEFSGVVQRHTDATGAEVTAQELWAMFNAEYVQTDEPLRYVAHHLNEHGHEQGIRLELEVDGRRVSLRGEGNGPIDAAVHALHLPLVVHSYEERALGLGANARAVAMVEVAMEGMPVSTFGVGIDPNIVTASIRAILSGANRLLQHADQAEREQLLKGLQAKLKAVA
ncbi:MAG: 2-isopropylmalate synthase [Betaproteobacteria bacterium]|nr:2-isopropylmalate synthase [Betaproteobacteria bacterium]